MLVKSEDDVNIDFIDFIETKEQFRQLLLNLHTGIVVHLPDTRIIFNNGRASELLGLSQDQMLGKKDISPLWHFVDEYGNKVDPSNYPVNRVIAKREAIMDMIFGVISGKDEDKITWLLVHAFPEFHSNGELRQIIVNFNDITIRVQAQLTTQKSEAKLESILQTMSEGIVLIDLNGQIEYSNASAQEILDIGRDDISGKFYQSQQWHQIDSQGNPYPLDQLPLARVLQKQSKVSNVEHGIIASNGDWKWLSVNAAPIFDDKGHLSSAIASFRDITKQKIAEKYDQFRTHILELLATGTSLKILLESICAGIESLNSSLRCQISVQENIFSSPSKAEEIPTNPCSSQSIYGSIDGQILGTFTLYAKGSNSQCLYSLEMIEQAAQLAGIAIEKSIATDHLKLAASVFVNAKEGIMITAPDGTIIDVNEGFCNITGYAKEEILGLNPRVIGSKRHGEDYYKDMWTSLSLHGSWSGEIWNRRKSGEIYPEMLAISAVYDNEGALMQYVALFSDMTLIKEKEKQLQHIAYYDSLTDLPNRVLLIDRMYQGIAQSQRRNRLLAVLFIDLDGFKLVNDTYGHDVGDQLLITLSANMKQTLREGDTLARIGGDEFVAVLIDLENFESTFSMLNRLLEVASNTIYVDDIELQISASIGVTFYPQKGEIDIDGLLQQADKAMYKAKQSGKNRYHIFNGA